MKYEATFGINDIGMQVNVEAVDGVYVNMIFENRARKNLTVSTIVASPGSNLKCPVGEAMMDRAQRLNQEKFGAADFGLAVEEFNRQLNFAVGMYSQSGREVRAGKFRKLVRRID